MADPGLLVIPALSILSYTLDYQRNGTPVRLVIGVVGARGYFHEQRAANALRVLLAAGQE